MFICAIPEMLKPIKRGRGEASGLAARTELAVASCLLCLFILHQMTAYGLLYLNRRTAAACRPV